MSLTVAPFSPLLSSRTYKIASMRWAVQNPQRMVRVGLVERESCAVTYSRSSSLLVARVIPESRDREKREVWVEMMWVGLGVWIMLGSGEAALAIGPQGPLMEEFWENMRRYGLYFFTVGTGALYTILKPIYELLKSPISALFIIVIISASLYLLYVVLSAMIGLSDFSYLYAS